SFLLSARRRRHLPIFPPRRSSDLPPAPLGAPPRGLAGGDAQQGVVLARDPHGGSGPVVPSGHRLLPPIRRALVGEPSRDPVARRRGHAGGSTRRLPRTVRRSPPGVGL